MPLADVNGNHWFARIPDGGEDDMSNTNNNNTNNNNCSCGCQPSENQYPQGYWMPGCGCPPPPYPSYPYECPPVSTGVGSIESQIAKLSKKSSVIRKMIDNLVNKNKSIVISVGCGAQYNFGTYLDAEGTETEYGTAVLEMLQAELEAIKAKIIELTAELEVADETTGGVEGTVTAL